MQLLLGKPVAERILTETGERIRAHALRPGLAVILVGSDPSSHLYVGLKEKAARQVGIAFEKHLFPATAAAEEICAKIDSLNSRESIHGILVQLPLPEHLPVDEIIARLSPEKDTDGFHPETLRRFLAGDREALPVFPRALLELLRSSEAETGGGSAVAVVNSELLGQVLVRALGNAGFEAEYVLKSSGLAHIRKRTQAARVVLTACGEPRFLRAEDFSSGTVILDGGISYAEGKVMGDVDPQGLESVASAFAPVPGGVGPVTVATLLARVTDAALRS